MATVDFARFSDDGDALIGKLLDVFLRLLKRGEKLRTLLITGSPLTLKGLLGYGLRSHQQFTCWLRNDLCRWGWLGRSQQRLASNALSVENDLFGVEGVGSQDLASIFVRHF